MAEHPKHRSDDMNQEQSHSQCEGTAMKLMTVKQLEELTGISKSKLYDLVESGELAHYRIGGSVRVSAEQWSEYLESCRHGRSVKEPVERTGTVKLKYLKI